MHLCLTRKVSFTVKPLKTNRGLERLEAQGRDRASRTVGHRHKPQGWATVQSYEL